MCSLCIDNFTEISRTIHVGTPAFLAPEILLKLVKSKGVDLNKEQRKQEEKMKRQLIEEKRQQKMHMGRGDGGGQDGDSMTVHSIGSHLDEEMSSDESSEDTVMNHYVRGAIKSMDPHIYCDFATDVYSYGIVIWSIITRKLPYKGFKPMDMILMIKNAQRLNVSDRVWRKWESCRRLDIDVQKLRDLLERCWAQYPYQRPNFEEIATSVSTIIEQAHNKNSSSARILVDPSSVTTGHWIHGSPFQKNRAHQK